MAFRGRGRGRGYGGGGFRIARQEEFIIFPDIEIPDATTNVAEQRSLVTRNSKLERFWSSSPYWIKDDKATNLSGFMKVGADYVPAELAKVSDSKQERLNKRKVVWNPTDLQKLDIFEKLEQELQGQDNKSEKDKKEGEDEEEDDENLEEEEEVSSDDDYNQNIDFDDDEDDFNMDDGNDDEPTY